MERDRAQRIAENEALFRNLNDEIEQIAERVPGADPDQRFVFACECANLACTARIELTLDEFRHVRRQSGQAVVIPGHEVEEVEDVVDAVAGYNIVRKRGEQGETFERSTGGGSHDG